LTEISFEKELALREAKEKERKEAHLYINVKVITEETFKHHSGTDLTVFDVNSEIDLAAPRLYKEHRVTQIRHLVSKIATDLGIDPRQIRLWEMINRQNGTIRPDQPIMDLRPTIEETFQRALAHGNQSLRVWAEVAEEVDAKGDAIWPKKDLVCLFLKCFDVDVQTLRGVCHVYIGKEKKIEELVPLILKKMGWGERLPPDKKILLWEVRAHSMICPGHL
jgi:ubiquitin carboxyl-terminal hydrolase 7